MRRIQISSDISIYVPQGLLHFHLLTSAFFKLQAYCMLMSLMLWDRKLGVWSYSNKYRIVINKILSNVCLSSTASTKDTIQAAEKGYHNDTLVYHESILFHALKANSFPVPNEITGSQWKHQNTSIHYMYMLLCSETPLTLSVKASSTLKWDNIFQMTSNGEIKVRKQRWQRCCLAYEEKYDTGKGRMAAGRTLLGKLCVQKIKDGKLGGWNMVQERITWRCNQTEGKK